MAAPDLYAQVGARAAHWGRELVPAPSPTAPSCPEPSGGFAPAVPGTRGRRHWSLFQLLQRAEQVGGRSPGQVSPCLGEDLGLIAEEH